jgi:hypothetical protein
MTQAICTIGATLGIISVNLELKGQPLQAVSSSPKPLRTAITQIKMGEEDNPMNFTQQQVRTKAVKDTPSGIAKNVIQYTKSVLLNSIKMTQAICTIGATLGIISVNLELRVA